MSKRTMRNIFCLLADFPGHCRLHLFCQEAPQPPSEKEWPGWLHCFLLWACGLPGIESFPSCCRDRLVPCQGDRQ